MAEPDDPDFPPTRSWDERGESPTIPATPPPRESTPPASPRRSTWQPPTPEELQPQFSQYEIRAIIGRGGMGAVYKGWQKSLRRFVAIKILPPQLEDNDIKFAERFQREAQAMARFAHPGIVSVFDAGETPEGLLYFIMEYVEGTDVQKMVASQGRLPPEHALAITSHVCDALAYAHRRGVIHRDIKPSNIMVDSEGRVKVADFGLAKVATDDSAALLTGSHVRMGTPDFMAPESAWGTGTVDHRADLYAVGVMLYQMLTGQLPRGRFDPPSRRVAGLDVRFDAIVDHALQTDPERRYSSAIEIRSDLDRILTEPTSAAPAADPPLPVPPPASTPVPPPSASEQVTLPEVIREPAAAVPRKSHPARWLIAIIGVGALSAIGTLLLHRPGSPPDPGPIAQPTPVVPTPVPRPPVDEHPATPAPKITPPPEIAPARATIDAPLVNTLGMKFVPVTITGGPTAGQEVLFSIWETRVQDYKVFTMETKRDWPAVRFVQGPSHPAVNVSWDDARAFCAWLTEREHKAGKLAAAQSYRLPTDHEWSCAVGIGERETPTAAPADKDKQFPDVFPWGNAWPPPHGAGNYSGEEAVQHKGWDGQKTLAGYRDDFPATAPCGSFPANRLGLFDLGGNAWEWCEDAFRPGDPQKTVRGASYSLATRTVLLSSARFHLVPTMHDDSTGFRCILATRAPQIPVPAPPNASSSAATTVAPFVNGLGMKFVPVPISGGPTGGQRVLFSIWETRMQDYQMFIQENPREWIKPEFSQDPTEPVTWVTWNDAQSFCAWLTERERKAGTISMNERYRLPTDHEWSCAVGIGDREDAARLPSEKSGKIADLFPWGKTWPPPAGAGNYSGEEAIGHETSKEQKTITGYRDGFPGASPVGSFAANNLGLFDLGGNAWEWCEDWFDREQTRKVARGASFDYDTRGTLLSSYRGRGTPDYVGFGFRCVLAAVSPTTNAAEESTAPAPASADILTSPEYEWSKPENLGPGVNSTKDEYALGISDDGLVLVLSSTREGTEHLFECRRENVAQPFGPAELISELRPGLQSGPFLSGDGLTLLYALQSNAQAISDIYQSHRSSRTAHWEKPARLFGPSSYNAGPCLSADGLTLWFDSTRTGGRGGFDLWRTHRPSSGVPFEAPVNLGGGVNTDANEFSPRVTPDNRALLFYRERHGSGQHLFIAFDNGQGAFTAQPLVFAAGGRVQSPTLSADGSVLYFASDMPGGQGGWDLWQIRRVPKGH
ncbi:MAG: SUMF1/EgtB/PvdO family nonheme iron enzyme [Chthoniobacter sp.]|nr:SUMF1/EgtB/PvdO family nonheme iron enzyme [Chthoniobacter sp.]